MLLHQLHTQLEKSQVFKEFKNKNPEAFLCAGFFILNFKNNIYDYSFDYRTEQEIFTFKVPVAGEIIMLQEPILDQQKPLEKINLDVQIDINDLRDLVEKELRLSGIKNKIEEIISVLQVINGRQIWNLTVMCEGFAIITIHIDAESGKLLNSKKRIYLIL